MNSKPILQRATFITSRELEFLSEKELRLQTGCDPADWPALLLKELIDNALDACENSGILPEIEVELADDYLEVRDNGPGLPRQILESSLDYSVRASDKSYYVSPSRGQLGNALKCVWAVPFVLNEGEGSVEVETAGILHRVTVSVDHIRQAPRITLDSSNPSNCKNGTIMRVLWGPSASYVKSFKTADFYKDLLLDFALFNPHASLRMRGWAGDLNLERTDPGFRKWRPCDPTSPHWYDDENLRFLIAAYLNDSERKDWTVRKFVSEFAGLSGSAKQKAVTDRAGLAGTKLADLVIGDELDSDSIEVLLEAMQNESREIKPKVLGLIGEDHFRRHLSSFRYANPEYVKYCKKTEVVDGLPYILELGFAVNQREYLQNSGPRLAGLNWSPTRRMPFYQLESVLGEARVDPWDPVSIVIHLASPRLDFVDRGKAQLSLPDEVRASLSSAIRRITKHWKRAKRSVDAKNRVLHREIERMRKAQKASQLSIKDAAYQVMEEAYMHASGDGAHPANARQIMYSARKQVQELTGGKCWKQSSYFTQDLLPNYTNDYPDLTKDWDVVWDVRGHISEPHTERQIEIGTLNIREYRQNWHSEVSDDVRGLSIRPDVDTIGPANRFAYALFIEKEGFYPQIKQAQLAEKYDLAVMSTKGMSVTAARTLVDELSNQGVTILVVRDFDKAGFSIAHTLCHSTWRFKFSKQPRVIDIGLRLKDVLEMNLQSEDVIYPHSRNPGYNLADRGATAEEIEFLVQGRDGNTWFGKRVELNAMTTPQFIEFLERKFKEVGVTKFTPSTEILRRAYKHAVHLTEIQKAVDCAIASRDGIKIQCPRDIKAQVKKQLSMIPEMSWDEAIWKLALGRGEKPTAKN